MDRQARSIKQLVKNIEKQVGGVTDQQAAEKVQEWQAIVEKTLQHMMAKEGYKPGGNVFYSRTGEYPTHTEQGAITSAGDEVIGTVGYTPYVVAGQYGYRGTVDITLAIEYGYQVRNPAWYETPSGEWARDFRRISYFGNRPPVPIRAMVIASLQSAAAADGVQLSLG